MAVAKAAARTQKIRLTSAVAVLSAGDPVRAFQEFATLDLISNGRAEIVCRPGLVDRGLAALRLRLDDYDSFFAEKLDPLLKIRENTRIYWSGKYRVHSRDRACTRVLSKIRFRSGSESAELRLHLHALVHSDFP